MDISCRESRRNAGPPSRRRLGEVRRVVWLGKPSAFTLVELLVVIAIIGMLVALLLPAVQAVRGRARTTQCASQIGELAKAMTNYESSKGNYPGYAQFVKRANNIYATAKFSTTSNPPSVFVESVQVSSPPTPSELNNLVPFSWATMILRNLERQDIWDQIVDSSMEPTISPVEVFRCPADTEASAVAGRAALSYNANTGAWDRDESGNFLATNSTQKIGDTSHNGLLFDLASLELAKAKKITTRLTDAKDGAATTILLSENVNKTYEPATGGQPYFTWLAGSAATAKGIEQQFGMVWVVSLTPGSGAPPLRRQEAINRDSSGVVDFDPTVPLFARPASSHGSGVNVAFCDSHTKFMRDDIDYVVYQQLMCPNNAKCVNPVDWTQDLNPGQPIDVFRRSPPLSEEDY